VVEFEQFHRDQRPAAVPLWRESLVGFDWLALRMSPVWYGVGVARGDRAPVVLVPGFLGTDGYLWELYAWLRRMGYQPYMSQIGRNADCLEQLMARLLHRIESAQAETGHKVHVIGHSLGGMLARSAATLRSESVASVVSLGSPFRGVRSHPFVLAAAARVRRRIHLDHAAGPPQCYTGYCGCPTTEALRATFPASISQLAVYTRTDGIVDWRFCVNDDPATDVEVPGTHIGLAFNPFAYRAIATHLATVTHASPRP
jgi:pimeloyl-ACP methyl ester carboxylesterase